VRRGRLRGAFFPTGQGNIIGNPIVPVIKLSGNPLTVRTMSEHIDVDLTGILRMEMNLDQAADAALKVPGSTPSMAGSRQPRLCGTMSSC
jgi:hypothetical protein